MSFPYGQEFENTPTSDLQDPLKMVISAQDGENDSFWEQILQIFGFNVGDDTGGSATTSLFSYVQGLANLALGLLAMVCLIILIYNFFMIFFAKEKEGVENAQKTLKRVGMVIIIIGLSWLIVTFMFWVIGQIVN